MRTPVRVHGLRLMAVICAAAALSCQSARYDVLIRGGQVLDGTGAAAVIADVGIRDGRIAAIGSLGNASATRTIDAEGLVVAPGFIDLHTHSDLPLVADGAAQSKVRQGVTVDVTGEVTSVAPRDGLVDPATDGVTPDWTTFSEYFARVERQGISINVIAHVSSEQVRRVVLGYDSRTATPAEVDRMKQLVARSMEEGAWGLATRFESGGPAHPEEVLEMAKVVARYGGNYTSHVGSEGFAETKEFAFAIRVADEAKLPVHLFHFKVRGRENFGTIDRYIQQIEAARARGLNITANQYPYTAMHHRWSSFFPLWMREGGPEKFAERLRDPANRARLKKDPDFTTWAKEHGWWDGIVLSRARTEANRKYEGKRISEIAKLRGDADPMDTSINLMAEEGGAISGIFHTMSEDDVRKVMKLPWVAVASDGSAINLEAEGVPHPRNYSTNARVLGHYVRDEKVLTLPEAVRKMTSLPAQILGLADRGQLKTGFAADVVVFDPARVAETNSFEKPKSYAAGVPFVLVNGVVVIDKGQHTGAKPGKALRGKGLKTQVNLTGSSSAAASAAASATPAQTPALPAVEALIARAKSLEVDTAYVAPPGDLLELDAAGFATVMCSAVFVTGLDLDFAAENVGYFTGPYASRAKLKKPVIDRQAMSVSVTLPNGVTRVAKVFGDQGCVLLRRGAEKPDFTPAPIARKLPPASDPWPNGDAPEKKALPAGLDIEKVKQALDAAFSPAEEMTAAFVATWRGHIIAERYGAGITTHTPLESWSMGKSIAATLMGLLIQDGVYALQQPAPIPEWQVPGDPRASIKISDLLTMSGGLRIRAHLDPGFDASGGYPDHLYYYTGAVDSFKYAATRPQQYPPGQVGRYRNTDPILINYLVRQAVEKRGENYLTYPQRALFDRIGIRSAVIEPDVAGNLVLHGYAYLSARDWTRLGLLYLRDGVWNGQRLLPEGFSKFVSTVGPGWAADKRPIYGGFFWINGDKGYPIPADAYFMAGSGGQNTFIIPSHDLVITRLGHYKGFAAGTTGIRRALTLLMEATPARQ